MKPEDETTAGMPPVDRPVRPCAWKCSTCANTSDCEGVTPGDNWCNSCGACDTMQPLYDRPTLDRLNSERLDLALLVGRLIHRMRAARDGRGIAAGDEALEQQAIGYLRRKGLISPLRDEGPNVGDEARPEAQP